MTAAGKIAMSSPMDTTLEAVVSRDRVVVISALAVVVALSWAYLLAGAGMGMSGLEMTRMSQLELTGHAHGHDMAMTPAVWSPGYAVLMFLMWWIMMVAMMLPSAAPAILVFATVNRRQREQGHACVATGIFALGYLAAWAGFSLVAVVLQWVLEQNGMLSPMLVSTNSIFGGILLLAAGLYQLTPIKEACLRHCRSPLDFLGKRWQQGAGGAIRMGLLHGAFCIGCCWILMALMFVGGLMNLYWIAGLAIFVLLEKTVPAGHWLGYATGIVLLAWGAGILTLTN